MNPTQSKTLVWDLPTRAFHWLLAACFATAFLTAESERLRDIHVLAGYTTIGLIGFRLLWGLVGTRYARFSSWSLAPRRVAAYLRSLVSDRPQHYVGHNPAGSWAIVAMLALLAGTATTGWSSYNDVGPGWLQDLHEGLANTTLALIVVHVLAVIASSLRHRENLVRAMLTGTKRGISAVPAAGRRTAVAVALVAAVGAFWAGWIPAPGLPQSAGGAFGSLFAHASHATPGDRDDD